MSRFFEGLRAAKVPVSLREYLAFLKWLRAQVVIYDAEGFYHLGPLLCRQSPMTSAARLPYGKA